ncbi:MAG: ferrous iron transport protein B [Thermoplasmata archaeon]|nr:MAG: ferrous iron transport protein B [Thermoplasmata archaeon]
MDTILLMGYPNVGKSVIFNALTGAYVVVSNYPGTTVAVDRGKTEISGKKVEIIDTPGMYSLLPITEEERVARDILLNENPSLIINVLDAKNIDRMLHLTLQLIETGLPTIAVLNMIDEAEEEGMQFDFMALEEALGIPVIPTAATKGEGLKELDKAITTTLNRGLAPGRKVRYSKEIEEAAIKIEDLLEGDYPISKRSIALFLLQGESTIEAMVSEKNKKVFTKAKEIAEEVRDSYARPLDYVVANSRQNQIDKLAERAVRAEGERPLDLKEKISRAMIRPSTGIPILISVIIGLYLLVGVFGAGELVDFIEGTLFEGHINPRVDGFLEENVPWDPVRGIIGGEFGIVTLGLRYAVAIIFPIVGIFFLAFSILEDTGYLPRLSLLIDRVFKKIGLSGRAVIPMTLGLGCDTMGTLVTRTLETKKERILATLLLALAIPCSAQLGVIFGILSRSVLALFTWAMVIFVVMLFIGWLGSTLIPGGKPQFFMELPPLRVPKLSNVLVKTYTRMIWYFKEVLPLFVIASVLLWLGDITGVFVHLVNWLAPLMGGLGLPGSAAPVFIYGFFRRDYGAAGLYDISGTLTMAQLTVAAVTLTLFIPCIAQVMMMYKERGKKVTLGIIAFIFPFAFFVGFLLNIVLSALGVLV